MPSHNIDQISLRRGVRHLRRLPEAATEEFLEDLACRIGGAQAIASLLNEYARISPPRTRLRQPEAQRVSP